MWIFNVVPSQGSNNRQHSYPLVQGVPWIYNSDIVLLSLPRYTDAFVQKIRVRNALFCAISAKAKGTFPGTIHFCTVLSTIPCIRLPCLVFISSNIARERAKLLWISVPSSCGHGWESFFGIFRNEGVAGIHVAWGFMDAFTLQFLIADQCSLIFVASIPEVCPV